MRLTFLAKEEIMVASLFSKILDFYMNWKHYKLQVRILSPIELCSSSIAVTLPFLKEGCDLESPHLQTAVGQGIFKLKMARPATGPTQNSQTQGPFSIKNKMIIISLHCFTIVLCVHSLNVSYFLSMTDRRLNNCLSYIHESLTSSQ